MRSLASDLNAGGGAAFFAALTGAAQQNGLGTTLTDLKNSVREGVAKDPVEALVVTVLGGSFLFYMAEKDENPKVKTYIDALLYISTCLSVGYADIFAVTQTGKAIATAVMTVGPSLAAKALDPSHAEIAQQNAEKAAADAAALAVQKSIAEKLDAILTELKKT